MTREKVELEDKIKELEQDFQSYKDNVADFLFENINLFNHDLINQIDNELGIDLCSMLELYSK